MPKTVRSRTQDDALPGLPDALPDTPPKATEYAALTLDEAIERAHAILDVVLSGTTVPRRTRNGEIIGERKLDPPERAFTLFSGGGDSSILAHLMRERTDGLVHIRTGIAIPETWDYVQAVAADWAVTLHAIHPEVTYQDLVLGRVTVKSGRGKRAAGEPVWKGFPGPAGHYLMYQRLKESALAAFRNSITGGRGRGGQIVYVGGMRWAESDRRFANAEEYDQWGSVVWCSPLVWWTNSHMAEYRARYLCNDNHEHAFGRLCRPGTLPLSPVSEKLHMSGDCLCGAFAKPGELSEIEFWYPDTAAQIHALMDLAKAEGIERCVWGAGKQPGEKASKVGRLCRNCAPPMEGQSDLFDLWQQRGLLSPAQYASLTAAT
ncbi:phosphoadenosine phosphosulfate reductase family protein [Micromonospora tulbaghiae]|uniref:phosphoadenosine phosphosulfate reductase domain-containing protein n=1 Tax=Micromonospora tulbaghiae TaxID=479978 RepID=UPI00332E6966